MSASVSQRWRRSRSVPARTAGIWSTARAREEIDNLPPYGPGVAIRETYDYVINVHCGVRWARIDGVWWESEGVEGRPPASGSVNWDAGDLTVDETGAEYMGSDFTVQFVRTDAVEWLEHCL